MYLSLSGSVFASLFMFVSFCLSVSVTVCLPLSLRLFLSVSPSSLSVSLPSSHFLPPLHSFFWCLTRQSIRLFKKLLWVTELNYKSYIYSLSYTKSRGPRCMPQLVT